MATQSSIPAGRIPWTEEPGGYHLWSLKESEVSEQLSVCVCACTNIHTHTHTHTHTPLTKHLLCAGHCTLSFVYINSLIPMITLLWEQLITISQMRKPRHRETR